ncbi:MAG: pantoate--beta-alanine ligase [Chitinophagaceae bacterium]|jgi:pantoate--beta-alanine ligase|nr:pantoate--beta-alanine ligase [Chitinophagaceae bacterium]
MLIFHRSTDLLLQKAQHHAGAEAAFVPTMGALHEGHISLIALAKKRFPLVMASIFVNPTQFNDPKDFEQYPITTGSDIIKLEKAGCDILFLPNVGEMYPEGLGAVFNYDLGPLENLLEGYYRPGHFQGVCRVVHKLIEKVQPTAIFMGAKDFQQCMVVQRLIETRQLPVTLEVCPTLREPDGLAMSSRNIRLTDKARQQATALYATLYDISSKAVVGADVKQLENEGRKQVLQAGFEAVDYISVAHPATLLPVRAFEAGQTYVVLIAAFLNGVRLIDNLVFEVK